MTIYFMDQLTDFGNNPFLDWKHVAEVGQLITRESPGRDKQG